RGADPIAEAILEGDSETGISIMLLDAGIDTGPILHRRSIPISEDETTGSLTAKLADLGAQALLAVLPAWIAQRITPEAQDEHSASHTRMLTKEDGQINWQKPAVVIARQVRAYRPWPGTYTTWRGKLLKIVNVYALALDPATPVAPGTVITHNEAGHAVLAIATGQGLLVVKQLQLEGKKAMSSEEFLRGYAQIVGQMLT
ncbi:MAG: methionyl-tRNA formyltransferase, partial [Chloroflexi bacterium]